MPSAPPPVGWSKGTGRSHPEITPLSSDGSAVRAPGRPGRRGGAVLDQAGEYMPKVGGPEGSFRGSAEAGMLGDFQVIVPVSSG